LQLKGLILITTINVNTYSKRCNSQQILRLNLIAYTVSRVEEYQPAVDNADQELEWSNESVCDTVWRTSADART
jgi:hypothetical protein